jgi:hypothetical protein
MKIEIEDYKGQTIYYEEDYDKFVCDISIEDKSKQAKRKSLKDVRREIDVFIKENLEFKPFKALEGSWGDIIVRKIEAIRTDGTLVVSGGSNSKYFYTKKQASNLNKFDPSILEELEAADKELDNARKKKEAVLAELRKRFVPIDLTKYNLQ